MCLANGTGGVLLIGVEDDGTVSGARPRHEAGRTDPLRVQTLIANMTQPALSAVAGIVHQQEQMILQYVDAHGQITRTEPAELCSLTPDQASPLCCGTLRRKESSSYAENAGYRNLSDRPDEAPQGDSARSLAQEDSQPETAISLPNVTGR